MKKPVNNIDTFNWLTGVFSDNKDIKKAIDDLSKDTPNEKVKGRYWGKVFEKDYLKPKIIKNDFDEEKIYNCLLLNNLFKALNSGKHYILINFFKIFNFRGIFTANKLILYSFSEIINFDIK